MTPDLQGYAGSAALALRLLGQCSLGSPGFFPTPNNFPVPVLASCLLPAPPPLLLISDPTPLPLPSDFMYVGDFHWKLSLLLFTLVPRLQVCLP
jgi:hypothetical protein